MHVIFYAINLHSIRCCFLYHESMIAPAKIGNFQCHVSLGIPTMWYNNFSFTTNMIIETPQEKCIIMYDILPYLLLQA